MNIILERNKFKDLFESAMLSKSSAMINPASFVFSDAIASASLMSADVMGVSIMAKPGFFTKYSVDDEEALTISEELLKTILSGFKEDEISITTNEDKILFESARDKYEIEQEHKNERKLPWELRKFKDYGFVPEKMNPKTAVIMQAKEFDVPPGLDYRIILKDGKLSMRIPDIGKFSREFNTEQVVGKEDREVLFDGKYFKMLLSNLKGKFLFAFDEDLAIFSETQDSCSKTFVLAAKIE